MTTTFHRHWRDVPRERLALAELQPGRDRLPGHRQAADQRARRSTAAGAARPAGQAADRPLRLSQPRAQPRRRRRDPVEASRRRRLRHRHGEPRSGGVRGGRRARSGSSASAFYPRSGFIHCRPRPRASVGRAVPGPGDGICSRDAARARGAGRQPHHEGRWRGGRGDAGRGRVEVRRASWPRPRPPSCRWCRISTRSAGCSSPWRSEAFAVTIYARLDDWKRGPPMIRVLLAGFATNPWAPDGSPLRRHRPCRASVPAVASQLRRAQRTPRRTTSRPRRRQHDVHRQMLEAAARRPRSRRRSG